MAHPIIKLFGAAVLISLSACYYDVESVLYPGGPCDTANLSYQADIAPILDRNCYSCHAANVNNGNVTLDSYATLQPYVRNGKLIGSIRHDSGFKAMPQNAPQIGTCDLAKIEQWVTDGALNN